jgi:hypothetical protein
MKIRSSLIYFKNVAGRSRWEKRKTGNQHPPENLQENTGLFYKILIKGYIGA